MLIPLATLLYSIESKYKCHTSSTVDENVLLKTIMITPEHDVNDFKKIKFEENIIYFCGASVLLDALEDKKFNCENVSVFFTINNCDTSIKNPKFANVPVVLFENPVFYELLNDVMSYFTSIIRWDKSIHEMIMNNCKLEDLMQPYSEISKYPLLILDIEFQVIAAYPGAKPTAEIENIIKQGYASEEIMRKLVAQKSIGPGSFQEDSTAIQSFNNPNKYNLYKQFRKNGKPVAFAFVLCESKVISNRFAALIGLFFNNLSFYFANTEKYDKLGTYLQEYVMESLLSSRNSIDRGRLENYLKTLDIPLEGSFWLIKIGVKESENIRLAYLRKLINNFTYMTTAFIYNEGLYILVVSKNAFIGVDPNLINNVIDNIKDALPKYGISFYVSNPFEKINEIYDAGIQCLALEQLIPENNSENNDVHMYDNFIIEHFISVLSGNIDLNSILPMQYKSFKQWDYSEKHNLYETLDQFLKNNCDFKASSELLGIHRNTMSNRIQLIEEHLGVDFNDCITRLKFTLAFTIDRFINDKSNNGDGPI